MQIVRYDRFEILCSEANPLDAMSWEQRFMAAFLALLQAQMELDHLRATLNMTREELMDERLGAAMRIPEMTRREMTLHRHVTEGMGMKARRAEGISITQIAAENGISRQRVRDRIKQAESYGRD